MDEQKVRTCPKSHSKLVVEARPEQFLGQCYFLYPSAPAPTSLGLSKRIPETLARESSGARTDNAYSLK